MDNVFAEFLQTAGLYTSKEILKNASKNVFLV